MKIKRDVLEKILATIQENFFGLTFEDIVKETGHHRATVKKYLDILEKWGFIISRRVGYYTMIFSSAIYEFIERDFAGIYMDSLIGILVRQYRFDKQQIFELSRNVAKLFSMRITQSIRRFLSDLDEKIDNMTEVVIPTIMPYLKFRIHRAELSDRILFIEVLEFKVREMPENVVCHFISGHIAGLLDALDIKFEEIKAVEQNKLGEKFECKILIILSETVEEIMNKIKEKLKLTPHP